MDGTQNSARVEIFNDVPCPASFIGKLQLGRDLMSLMGFKQRTSG